MVKAPLSRLLALVILVCLLPLSAFAQTKIRIATEGTNPPFSIIDASGEVQGFDVDIAKALCAKMQAECEITEQDWDGIMPALLAKKYDAIVASLNITEDRKKVVAFTTPYYRSPSVFVVRKGFDATDISPRALTGKPVGVQTATNHSAFLEDKYRRSIVRLYNTVADAYRDLSAGRVDYVLYDKLAVYDWLKTPEGQCCEIAPTELADEAYFGSGVGIALRKGDEALVKRFNDALDGIVKDGTYAKINAKYFPFPVF
ncbi:transporter substrate-binding domain-containing protein [Rhodomicrobium sp. Az07]|uniref:transporter substrate-binding domain-containing protein n=1 Tax=Rhodomicrobium sp. Az07 TaxID=2839034 RepID=UPI001BE78D32|nr:transporter substrate-binding domain-containing protein [Rhodomicrobium sp. Az07]MBT3071528.1 transporter substrate-binding domain-containing protein [Rhodomicrobium sp. Az07]